MKKLSRKTKRLLAFLIVEVVLAVNVFSVFAAENETVDVSEETEVVEEATNQESDVVETGELTYVEEQPESIVEENPSAENKSDDLTVGGEVPTAVPAESENVEEVETIDTLENLQDEAITEEGLPDTEETKEYTETVEVDHTVKVYGKAVMNGTSIEGFENFTLVGGKIEEQYPQIDGYVFKTATYEGKEISKVGTATDESSETVKKVVYDEETLEEIEADVLVTTKTYSTYLMAGEEKIDLNSDATLLFEYALTEEKSADDEKTEASEGIKDIKVSFTSAYENLEGETLEGLEPEVLSFTDTYDLTKAPEIEGYEFLYAKIDGRKVSSLSKETIDIDESLENEDSSENTGNETSEESEEVNYTKEVVYSYITSDGETIKAESDTTVIYVYKSLFKEIVLNFEVLDKDGKEIRGFETVEAPIFETELILDDSKNAPIEIEDYEFVEASIKGETISAIIKDEKHENVFYVTTPESEEKTALEEDTTVTLTYKEAQYSVKVLGTVVDEFDDPIDDKFTEIELPKFEDELILDDVDNPPYENIQIRKGLFKVIKYTYVKAKYDGDVITNLKKTAITTGDVENNVDSSENDEADENGFAYEYSVDGGENWKKIKEDATITFEYSDGKKTTYTYEDAFVSVTATLQHANAIPDDAEFRVTAVTPDTAGYDYAAYMEALNKSADALGAESVSEEGDTYDENNTLLYDIAFLAPALDENGEEIEGSLVEYQPAEGMVNISMSFKQNQLEEELQAQEASDITVVHMPLIDSVKESVDTTADATNLSVADIQIEVVNDSTSVQGESTDFTLSDFSVLGFLSGGELCASDKFPEDGYSLEYVLNGFNVVSFGDATLDIHVMGAVIVEGTLSGGGSGFADSAYVKKPSYIGKVKFDHGANTRKDQNPVADLFVGKNNTVNSTGTSVNGYSPENSYNRNGKVYKNPDYIDFEKLYKAIYSDSQALPDQKDRTLSGFDNWGEVNVDAGTTVNVTLDGKKLTINVVGTSDEATVINVLDNGNAIVPKVTGAGKSAENGDSQPVVINYPYASKVTVTTDRTPSIGHILAPQASIVVEGGNFNGCLVGSNIYSNGEGHLWPYTGKKIVRPASYALKAKKKVDGRAATSSESNLFEFKLIQLLDDGTEKVVDTVKNSGSEVGFKQFGDVYNTGTYWYKIVESSATDGYTKDETVYYAEVKVTQQTSGRITNTNSDITYHISSKSGNPVSVPTFNNTSVKYKKFHGTKFWDDNKNQDGLRPQSIIVTITDVTNNKVVDTVTVSGNLSADSWDWVSNKEFPDKNPDGTSIQYKVEEQLTSTTYEQDESRSRYYEDTDSWNFYNTHNPETTFVAGSKTWNDNGDQDGKRPESITIRLMNGTKEVDRRVVSPDNDGNWSWKFEGLQKYANGQLINYTIEEEPVAGYGDPVVDGYNVTNTHSPETTSVSGSKTWDDNNNQDGKRPASITVRLWDGENEVDSKTVTENDGWAWKFTDLPKYRGGEEISYSITEDSVAEYNSEVSDYNVTNTHTPKKTSVSGSKTWDDNDNQDGKRPESITIHLIKNVNNKTEEVTSKTVTAKDNWAWEFTNLDQYEGGKEIVYSVTEDNVEGYSTNANGMNVTNTYSPGKVTVSGNKVWDDNNNQDGIRPTSITVKLFADGAFLKSDTFNVAADGTCAWSFSDLDEYKAGKKIVYSIEEETVEGYSTAISPEAAVGVYQFNITNTHTPETTKVIGKKIWDDNNNQDRVRPLKINVYLFANGEQVDSTEVEPDEKGDWIFSFTDLPKKANGKEIIYTVEEEPIEGYKCMSIDGYYNITNYHKPEETSLEGIKIWEDNDNQDNIRPSSVTIHLYANGTEVKDGIRVLNEANGWKYLYENLPKYADGVEIVYTIVEDKVSGYNFSHSDDYTEITNTHEPEKTSVLVTKEWDDNDDQDGLRAKIDSIKFTLFADGVEKESKTTTAAQNWVCKFENLDKFNAGKEIKYTVVETPVDGYTSSNNGYAFTNTHTPATVDISGTKNWQDNDDQDGKRPGYIKVRLYADGVELVDKCKTVTAEEKWSYSWVGLPKFANGNEIIYTISEDLVPDYTTDEIVKDANKGFVITNRYTPGTTDISVTKNWVDNENQDGLRDANTQVKVKLNATIDSALKNREDIEITLNEGNNWTYTWKNLPAKQNKAEVKYSVEELTQIPGYSTSYAGLETNNIIITNSHETEKTSVSGKKIWIDNENQDGVRPASIDITLLKNGKDFRTTTAKVEDGWKYSFDNLDKYENGELVTYTVKEVRPEGSAWINFYKAEDTQITKTEKGYNITNQYKPETVEISGTKTWQDNDNQDGVRPETIIVHLLQNGTEIKSTSLPKEDGSYSYSWSNLPKYHDGGQLYTYSVSEDAVSGYTTTYITDTYDIVNTHNPGKTSVGVTKIWEDKNNQDGLRPDSIEVSLLADGGVEDTVTLSDTNSWTYTWSNLDEKRKGEQVKWTVREEKVLSWYNVKTTGTQTMYTLTNTHETAKTEIHGLKVWNDKNNQDGKRPETATVRLWADGVDTGKTQTVSAANNWKFAFTGLDKFKNSGTEIIYSVSEDMTKELAESYECKITGSAKDGFTITNTHATETTELNGTKHWNDNNDQDGVRPESVTVKLLADGKEVEGKELVITEASGWSYSFKDLPVYSEGKEISYSVIEKPISINVDPKKSYTTTYKDNDIINTYTPGTTGVSVVKVWDDASNQDGIQSKAVTVRLVAKVDNVEAPNALNGVQATQVINASNEWKTSWAGLPLMQNKKAVVYSVVEEDVPDGYTCVVSGSNNAYTITNTHIPETVSVSGQKIWNDNDNRDGIRPENITVRLLADGVDTGKTQTVSASKNWNYSFTDLPKYRDAGRAIKYTAEEDSIGQEYAVSYKDPVKNGNNIQIDIKNTHIPATINLEGYKIWDDASNQDGKRPSSITVNLLADGVKVDEKTVQVGKNGSYSWTFSNLAKYKEGEVGKEIQYTFTEEEVDEYTTKVDGNVITNSYNPGKKNVSVTKRWEDEDNQDGKRPKEIEVRLSADRASALSGVENTTVKLTEGSWSYTWENLPEMQDGTVVTYSVDEVSVPEGYTKTKVDSEDKYNFVIKNTHAIETTEVSGTKTWDDEGNQDGMRPGSVTIRLHKTVGLVTSEVGSKVVTASDGWKYSWTNLPKFEGGQEITYTLTEDALDADLKYTTSQDGYDFTNKHVPEITNISVEKKWIDNDDQDGIRPDKVLVTLMANGVAYGEPVEISEATGWKHTFENLPVYQNTVKVNYSVSEAEVANYSTNITKDDESGYAYTITNTYTPGKKAVSVSKVWDDAKDQDNLRPSSVTVRISASVDGALDGRSDIYFTLNEANGWKYTWEELPIKWNKQDVVYSVDEIDENGSLSAYTKGIDDTNPSDIIITNTHNPEMTSVSGQKIWNDAGNQDGKRPESITVVLYADNEVYDTKVISGNINEDTWSYSFNNLPKYKHGQEKAIVYTVDEVLPDGYEKRVDGYTITNTHAPELTNVDGTKTWYFDPNLYTAEDELNARPESIEITLMAKTKIQEAYRAVDKDGYTIDPVTVSASDNWAWSFDSLPKFRDGNEIEYFVIEGEVPLYKTTLNGMNVTNTYMPGEKTVTVKKEWADNDNQDGGRPKGVVVQLYRDGFVDVKAGNEVVLDESNDWSYEWKNLPKNKTLLGEYQYTVKEVYVIDDNDNRIKINNDAVKVNDREYTVSVVDSNGDFVITNKHEEIKTTLKGVKFWDDNFDMFQNRPSSIQIIIKKGDLEVDRIVLDGDRTDDQWAWESKELPMYENGKPICYVAEEYLSKDDLYYYPAEEAKIIKVRKDGTQVEAGEDTGDEAFYEYLFYNVHDPMAIKVEGHKEWLPGDYTEEEMIAARPDYIDLELWGRTPSLGEFRVTVDVKGKDLPNKGTARVVPDENGDWHWSFENILERRNREDVTYFVKETPVKDFSTYPVEGDEMSLQNKYTPETKELKVVKVWDDADNQDGVRPIEVTVQLYRGIKAYGEPIVLNEENNWTGIWDKIPARSFASYSVKEISVTNADGTLHDIATDTFKLGVCEYQILVTENGDQFTVTNSHKPLTTVISGEKTWDDGGNESRRPSSIKIRLYADGVEVASKDVTARDGWKWSFTDIPLNRAGKIAEPIEYTISEDNVPNYSTSINGFNVKNTYNNPPTTPGETPPPSDPPRYTPPRTPEPTPTPEPDPPVLGASRRPGGSVLGAKRSMQPAVLGKRRRPTTGDSLAIFYYMAGFIGSLSGAITSGVKLKKTRKEDE